MRIVLAALAFLALSAPARAAPACIFPEDRAALQVALLRSELMVAALQCGLKDYYDRLLAKFSAEFAANQTDLTRVAARLNVSRDVLLTEFAARAAHKTVDPAFCSRQRASFDQALTPKTSSVAGISPAYDILSDLALHSCPER